MKITRFEWKVETKKPGDPLLCVRFFGAEIVNELCWQKKAATTVKRLCTTCACFHFHACLDLRDETRRKVGLFYEFLLMFVGISRV